MPGRESRGGSGKGNRFVSPAQVAAPLMRRRPTRKGHFASGLVLRTGDELVVKSSESHWHLAQVAGALPSDSPWMLRTLARFKDAASRIRLQTSNLPSHSILGEQGRVGDWFRMHFSGTAKKDDVLFRLCDGGHICTKYLDRDGRCACQAFRKANALLAKTNKYHVAEHPSDGESESEDDQDARDDNEEKQGARVVPLHQNPAAIPAPAPTKPKQRKPSAVARSASQPAAALLTSHPHAVVEEAAPIPSTHSTVPSTQPLIVSALNELVGRFVWVCNSESQARQLFRVINVKHTDSDEVLVMSHAQGLHRLQLKLTGHGNRVDCPSATFSWGLASHQEFSAEMHQWNESPTGVCQAPTQPAMPSPPANSNPTLLLVAPTSGVQTKPSNDHRKAPPTKCQSSSNRPKVAAPITTTPPHPMDTGAQHTGFVQTVSPLPENPPASLNTVSQLSQKSLIGNVALTCLLPDLGAESTNVSRQLKQTLDQLPENERERAAYLLGKTLAGNVRQRGQDFLAVVAQVRELLCSSGVSLTAVVAGMLDTVALWTTQGALETDPASLEATGNLLFLAQSVVTPPACVKCNLMSASVARVLRAMEDRLIAGQGDAFVIARGLLVEWACVDA